MSLIRLLALSGSLRRASTNTALIQAAQRLQPEGVEIDNWHRFAELPHFTPDLEEAPPPLVTEIRQAIGRYDGLIIACPEYARGIPGSFKNGLDWLVGGETFINVRIALWNASPRASAAQSALRLVLETMSGIVVEEAALGLPLINKQVTGASLATNPEFEPLIRASLTSFANHLRRDRLNANKNWRP